MPPVVIAVSVYFGIIALNIFLNLIYPFGMKETFCIPLLIVFYILSPITVIVTISDLISFERERERKLYDARMNVLSDLKGSKYEKVDKKTLAKLAEYLAVNQDLLDLPTFLEIFEEMENREAIVVSNGVVYINNDKFLG